MITTKAKTKVKKRYSLSKEEMEMMAGPQGDGSVKYTLADYIEYVKAGLFISYDGIGYLGNDKKIFKKSASFSVKALNLLKKEGKYTHVYWYGK